MRNSRTLLLWATSFPWFIVSFSIADTLTQAFPQKTDSPITFHVRPFELGDVRLLDGPFKDAMEYNSEWLLLLEPDRFLAWFRKEAGLEPKAEVYGGWEKETIAGHSLGHYLSACAMMYGQTGRNEYKDRTGYIVDGLAACQKAGGSGYLSAFPNGKKAFGEVARGEIRSAGFDLNGIWVPWYTQHKLMAGLRDIYHYTGNKKALAVWLKHADWIESVVGNLTDEQWQTMLACEHGGINETFADLYAITGDQKYLVLSKKFYHKAVLDPLSQREDKLSGLHANTQIPKIIGAARIYELTGDEKFETISDFFWNTVVGHYSYANGGNSADEHFGRPDHLAERMHDTTETCNTYNMLKLTRHLFTWDPQASYMDYYERALFNHILAHQHPQKGGRLVYKGFLDMPAKKGFSDPTESFWCCVGTGMENHTKYADTIYAYNENSLYVNLFIASELTWRDKGVVVTQKTSIPGGGNVTLSFACEQPVDLGLKIRKPGWVDSVTVMLNGKKQDVTVASDGYLTLNRTFKDNDLIALKMPLKLHVSSLPDMPNRIAFLYGPTLLAAPLEADQSPPMLVSDDTDTLLQSFQSVAPLEFEAKEMACEIVDGSSRRHDLRLVPLFSIAEKPYTVYMDMFTADQWKQKEARDYPYEPVPFTAVHFDDIFWAPRLEKNRTVTVPYAFGKCEESKRYYNFERAAKVLQGEKVEDLSPPGFPFDDTDPYKVLEGASFGLAVKYDPEMDAYLDKIIALIASAQESDGYLFTTRTTCPENPHEWAGKQRWVAVKKLSHELYNMGHLYEATAAHYQATGKRTLLDVALKNADLLCEVFGPGKNQDTPGHQIVEMGLVKLYRITGDEKYLKLAKFFLDQRGDGDGDYSQAHEKVVDQDEAVGHAVRAMYMYSGMTDVAALTDDQAYKDALQKIWDNMVTQKLYITGGIGALHSGEAFGPNYMLPNMSAYCETCAAIGSVYWNHRMFLLYGDSQYIDILERTLYNGVISGISLDGKNFFYPNPLESKGQHNRSPWFGCACCPSNITRFLASVPGYAYAKKDDTVYVNLFAAGTAEIALTGNAVKIQQETKYPWDGQIKMTVTPEKEGEFSVYVRIPGWALNNPVPGDLYSYCEESALKPTLQVNGKELSLDIQKGYLQIERQWKPGDTIELELPMPIRKVVANEKVKEDRDRIAIQRGPIVYCLEGADAPDKQVRNLIINPQVSFQTQFKPDLLEGVQVLTAKASAVGLNEDGERTVKSNVDITAIPYYAWCNRGANEMVVWLPTKEGDAFIKPRPTIASESKVTGSKASGPPQLVVDQADPKNSHDKDSEFIYWWPKKGTTEWIQFDFDEPTTLSAIEVYWFDDTGHGGCRVPQSWKLMYLDEEEWKPVQTDNGYGTEIDQYNRTTFKPVKTSAVKVEAQLQVEWSGGVHEVRFK